MNAPTIELTTTERDELQTAYLKIDQGVALEGVVAKIKTAAWDEATRRERSKAWPDDYTWADLMVLVDHLTEKRGLRGGPVARVTRLIRWVDDLLSERAAEKATVVRTDQALNAWVARVVPAREGLDLTYRQGYLDAAQRALAIVQEARQS